MCTSVKKCLLSSPVQASAAPRPETSESDEEEALFGLHGQITQYIGPYDFPFIKVKDGP
jgi:hypothetical protein